MRPIDPSEVESGKRHLSSAVRRSIARTGMKTTGAAGFKPKAKRAPKHAMNRNPPKARAR